MMLSGLSPRMRGNRRWRARPLSGRRSIPAYAGKPASRAAQRASAAVYPRVCGETDVRIDGEIVGAGLSPRMRGNPDGRRPDVLIERSIPAYAGKPEPWPPTCCRPAVYPRVCGETLHAAAQAEMQCGLSPRMRGNPLPLRRPAFRYRSIPAYAGKPTPDLGRLEEARVYPRVCGETRAEISACTTQQGLSPRMRGNLGDHAGGTFAGGSIPAYAGKPPRTGRLTGLRTVYPRVCGETVLDLQDMRRFAGLSPRMRGNPSRAGCGGCRVGSIPAYAGKPSCRRRNSTIPRVYPRVCGETIRLRLRQDGVEGLSPRMRGNREDRHHRLPRQRSIPAYAGKPTDRPEPPASSAVYPRVCGETSCRTARRRYRAGLSPRMRGNLERFRYALAGDGSIPAYAGKPPRSYRWHAGRRVYPRVCGETLSLVGPA